MSIRSIAAWLIPWMIVSGFLIFTYPEPNERPGAIQNLSYSEFMDHVDRGNIATVNINNTGQIDGELKDPIQNSTKFSSKTLDADMGYVESLRKDIKSKNPNAIIILKKSGGSFLDSLFGMLPFILLVGFCIWFMRRAQGQQINAMNSFIKPRARLSQDHDKKTFQDVAGAEEAKEDLQEIVGFLKDPQKFQRLGAHIPKGVLLIGPPGTGKTLLARAVAGEAKVPFSSISGSEFVEMFVGVGASRVRDLFEKAKKDAPCIIFIDELDAVGRRRGTGIGGGHDEREQTLNQLLVEMDGFTTNNGVIIIAATNRPDVLDPALLRPGRFDRRVVVDRPDINGRFQILLVHTKNVPLENGIDLKTLAKGTSGFTGADLANLVNEAALFAGKENASKVSQKHFEEAKDKVMMGAERKSLLLSPDEKKITAYHEAGHAIVASAVPEADPIHKVTIIPRGMALGLTQQLPEADRHNYSKTHLKSQLAILMAGRCAEELILNEYSTGASNDIERATEISREMVCSWGMSEKLGALKFGTKSDSPFLGKQLTGLVSDYSQATAEMVDEEMKALVVEAQMTATRILNDKKSVLISMAQVLIEKETIDGEEVRRMLDP